MLIQYRSLFFILLFCIYPNSFLKAHCTQNTSTADYVIIGVGTAGAVLAKKLTDDKKTSVIALHSGKNLTEDPDIKYSKNAFTTVLAALTGSSFHETGELGSELGSGPIPFT